MMIPFAEKESWALGKIKNLVKKKYTKGYQTLQPKLEIDFYFDIFKILELWFE